MLNSELTEMFRHQLLTQTYIVVNLLQYTVCIPFLDEFTGQSQSVMD